ncbi:MAG: DNA ligase D, partial [Candidatus Saccharibacteria bacterium]|nr:DNA ligase D [Pseudorhodobacter sp.]
QARIEAGRVKLLTRAGLDWTRKFGTVVVEALQNLPLGTAVLDGEMLVETQAGMADFSALQADLSTGRSDRFVYYAFDLLYLDGYDLRPLMLTTRKDLLAQLLSDQGGPLRYSTHFLDSGATVLRHACQLGLEGVVSKVKDAPYRSGRGKAWQKSKCGARQEFVIAGYVPSSVGRRAIGSLVLGVQTEGKLRHVGRVGTGFSALVAEALFAKLDAMRVADSPFAEPLTATEARQVRYVRPDLVAEVAFAGWTGDGHLRHASFRGLRDDKAAGEIMREDPDTTAQSNTEAPSDTRHGVKLTHPDRIYWPDAGVTKQGLADYYTQVWDHIAPHVIGRPLALLRCPTGITGDQFFQKNAWKGSDAAIILVDDPKGADQLISIDSLDGLIGLVQGAALEIHPWGSTVADWERPDRIVMDLDPGEDVAWPEVIAAAQEVRDRLTDAGLAAFVKTSGGKGLHVVAPLTPKADWVEVKAFAKGMADQMAADSPELYVATVTKSKRHGKILIDYLRNQRGATAVAAFSTRARPGAPVSAPLTWEELGPAIGPAHFTVDTMPRRLAVLPADPWADYAGEARPLKSATKTAARKRK